MKSKKSNEVVKYTKNQILTAKKYKHNKDVINVILKEEGLYTLNEVDNMINKFMKGKVN